MRVTARLGPFYKGFFSNAGPARGSPDNFSVSKAVLGAKTHAMPNPQIINPRNNLFIIREYRRSASLPADTYYPSQCSMLT